MTNIMKSLSIFKKIALIALASLAFSDCARNPVTGRRQLSFMSTKGEIRQGQQYDPQVQAEFGVYDDQKLQNFLTEKGKAMAKISHRPNLPWQFKVVDSPVVNAFAVPGGYVYFTRGIMAHFNDEAQLAGVLGHEMGHVTARHGARQQTGQILGQLGLIAGLIAAPELAQYADAASQGLGLLFLKFSRNHESESDKLGVVYSTKIGYDAQHMADFFKTLRRLSEKSGQGIPTFLSTHPDPADREKNVKNLAIDAQNKLARTGMKFKEGRDEYLRLIDGIVYGDDPKQGFVERNQFYHPELKFEFPVPTSWKWQNAPSQFQMASQDGKAMMLLTLADGKTLEEAAQNASKQLGLRIVESRRTTVNGLKALQVVSEVQQQQQGAAAQQQGVSRSSGGSASQPSGQNTGGRTAQSSQNTGNRSSGQSNSSASQPSTQQAAADAVRAISSYIEYNGHIYAIHGLTYASLWKTYSPVFESVQGGFKPLSDPDKLNRQPERIRVRTVERDGTFKQTMQAFGMPDARLEELAILNGMEQNTPLKAGSLIKTVAK